MDHYQSAAYARAMDGLDQGLLPVLLVGRDDDGEPTGTIEWHLFSIEDDGPAYDDNERLRERFVCGVAIAVRYHDVEHDCEGET